MEENQTEQKSSNGYSKRPLWQWIVIYIIVGAIIYALVYYFFLRQGISSPYGY